MARRLADLLVIFQVGVESARRGAAEFAGEKGNACDFYAPRAMILYVPLALITHVAIRGF